MHREENGDEGDQEYGGDGKATCLGYDNEGDGNVDEEDDAVGEHEEGGPEEGGEDAWEDGEEGTDSGREGGWVGGVEGGNGIDRYGVREEGKGQD